jgi:NADH-quinone oxidoreductase subunit L
MEHGIHQLGPILVERVSTLWLIPLFPLVGAAINATVGLHLQRAFGKRAVHAIGVGAMVLSLLVALLTFAQMVGLPAERRFLQDTLWNLFTAGRLTVDLAFALDPLSMTMVLIITFVGTLIHVFSIGYMAEEAPYWRFFAWLNLFVFSMLLLVMGENFAVMFFGWEGVGLCSYLLISYYHTDPEKAAAGMKAFIANRIGDFGFLAGLLVLFWALGGSWTPRDDMRGGDYRPDPQMAALAGATTAEQSRQLAPVVDGIPVGPTLSFRELRDQIVVEKTGVREHLQGQTLWGFGVLAVIGILLFVGAMGKSAQIPLYVWLPDAMAGPTPVSALIHAATMVTAGVYMVARLNFLFALSPSAMGWVAFIGALTALFAATIGFFQYDIKKVLAYSTVSQLGFMFVGVGSGAYYAGVLHLVTHAFFKACLFLGAGSVMHGMGDDTDIRNMGGLGRRMPHTRWTFLVATLAITGVVPLSGFFSKDAILAGALFAHNRMSLAYPWVGPTAWALGTLAAAGTAFYMMRLYALTFSGEPRTEAARHAHESSPVLWGPLAVLAVLSAVGLVLGLPGEGPWGELFRRFTDPNFAPALRRLSVGAAAHHAAWPFLVAWVVALVFGGLGWAMYAGPLRAVPGRFAEALPGLHRFAAEKFRVDELYDALLVRPLGAVARLLWRAGDAFVIDGILVNGTARAAQAFARIFRTLQNGDVQRYAAVMALAVAAILWTALGRGGP